MSYKNDLAETQEARQEPPPPPPPTPRNRVQHVVIHWVCTKSQFLHLKLWFVGLILLISHLTL